MFVFAKKNGIKAQYTNATLPHISGNDHQGEKR